MKRLNNPFKDAGYFLFRCISPLFDPLRFALGVPRYIRFFRDLYCYSRMDGSEPISLLDLFPIIHDKTAVTRFDKHYFYQDIWAFRHIWQRSPQHHVDVGSRVDFIGFLTTIVQKVIFVDIRPIPAQLASLCQVKGDILSLPFATNSVMSLSCLHVAEHIGLGRYGDSLEPYGTQKACRELTRILSPHGDLYFSLPVGSSRVCFNAHRVHSPFEIIQYFEELDLVELAGVDDNGQFMSCQNISLFAKQSYACGFFHFRKGQN